MEDNKHNIIYFPHGVGEHTKQKGIIYGWNTGKDKRKFLLCNGEYIDEKNKKQIGRIMFWGEWEADSVVHKFRIKGEGKPISYHEPLLNTKLKSKIKNIKDSEIETRVKSFYNNQLNTDPYVFGKRFLYSNCRQRGNESRLRNLKRGDIIIFYGSRTSSKKSYIDTVFVIGGKICDFSKKDYKDVIKSTSKVFQLTTLYPIIYSNDCNNCGKGNNINTDKEFTLYYGATYDDPVIEKDNNGKEHKLYSYFPCIRENKEEGFERTNIIKFINYKSHQNIKIVEKNNYKAWKEITDRVREDGLLLGTKAKEPTLKI